jgi:hypothetical protein
LSRCASGRTPKKEAATRARTAPSAAKGAPAAASPLSRLQASIGNRGIARLLQSDREEHEAERVARSARAGRQVSTQGAPPGRSRSAPGLGPGQPLAAPTRSAMESRIGADLGSVRVHSDPGAASVAEALGTRAFTVGEDVVAPAPTILTRRRRASWLSWRTSSAALGRAAGR